jgi:hypothetical protein
MNILLHLAHLICALNPTLVCVRRSTTLRRNRCVLAAVGNRACHSQALALARRHAGAAQTLPEQRQIADSDNQ